MRKDYSSKVRKLDTKELVHQIVFLIINREDYKEAAKIMFENSISVETLSNSTTKLTSIHFANLTDEILTVK